jgi:hypothetical protein
MPRQEEVGVMLAPVERLAVPAREVPEAAVVVKGHRRRERLAQVGQLGGGELRDAAAVMQGRESRGARGVDLSRHANPVRAGLAPASAATLTAVDQMMQGQ